MQIGFYGEMGERIGREVDYDLTPDVRTVAELRRSLAATWPSAAETLLSPRLKVFIADTQVGDDATVEGVGRVEFLPPLSGG